MREVVFLGTGTSHGVPMIGCECRVCRSEDPRDKRTRTSLLIKDGEQNILIDAGIDLRQQALREKMNRLDAVLFTHTHVDHLFGLDEVRRFNVLGNPEIPVYASADSSREIRRVYPYIFNAPKVHGGIPAIRLIEIDGAFTAGGVSFQPVPVMHGETEILGFRFDDVAYLTDCSEVPDSSMPLLEGVRVLIVDGLRQRPHPTHFNLQQACELSAKLGAEQTWLVHMTHDVLHAEASQHLPARVRLAYDGLRLTVT
jgi:phosphoribosyl 1,2-cyclic phosphate phosphodiesterase